MDETEEKGMQCQNVNVKLSAFIDGELAKHARREIQEHLKSCDACRQTFEELSHTWEILSRVQIAEKSPYLYTRIRARLDAQRRITPAHRWQRFAIPLASIGVVALGVFFGSAMRLDGKEATTLTAEEYFGSLDLDMFQDFPKASLSAVYFDDATQGGER
jgi:predicted anti-sigma-YlaC factor YlaD